MFIEALKEKTSTTITNLPEDTQLLDMKFDLLTNQILAVVRSDSFDDIPETYPIPEFKLAYSTGSKPEIQPTIIGKTSSARPQPEQAKTTHPPSKMEQEFTPEQRRLLSFKTEGDRVIVKPTQFLKAEWEDINEVVKSLGGKWVKGDIISYWEIPTQ